MTDLAPPIIDRFAPLAADYDVVLSDVWGVIHNGVNAFPEAVEALAQFRGGGGTVVLISNAPRQGTVVMRLLDRLGVTRAAYDGIVTSGDVTRSVVAARPGQRIFHIGPERDRSIFDDLPVRFAAVEQADYVVCSGLFDDESEVPQDYRPLLEQIRARHLLLVCANPDLVVERGDRLVYCAGAIADLYVTLGGEVLFAGKPHAPIYSAALAAAAAARGGPVAPARVLAIGDSVRTDLAGAAARNIDCLFITAGIHAEELGGRDDPDPRAVSGIFAGGAVKPKAVMRRLVW
jgi:HAD superfamily hydrolase (TIGR01459 family)